MLARLKDLLARLTRSRDRSVVTVSPAVPAGSVPPSQTPTRPALSSSAPSASPPPPPPPRVPIQKLPSREPGKVRLVLEDGSMAPLNGDPSLTERADYLARNLVAERAEQGQQARDDV